MRRAVWGVAAVLVLLWSLVAWASYGLIGVFGGLATEGVGAVPGYPEGIAFLSWALGWVTRLGLAAVAMVWAAVSAGILALAWVVASLMPDRTRDGPYPTAYRTPGQDGINPRAYRTPGQGGSNPTAYPTPADQGPVIEGSAVRLGEARPGSGSAGPRPAGSPSDSPSQGSRSHEAYAQNLVRRFDRTTPPDRSEP